MKYVFTVGIPLFVIFLQVFLKYICEVDYTSNLGITIGAIGLGQIFPFIAFENLLISKILNLKSNHQLTGSGFTVEYFFEHNGNNRSIEKIKGYAFGLLLLSIMLFMIIVVMSANNQPLYYVLACGAFNCILTWTFILSK